MTELVDLFLFCARGFAKWDKRRAKSLDKKDGKWADHPKWRTRGKKRRLMFTLVVMTHVGIGTDWFWWLVFTLVLGQTLITSFELRWEHHESWNRAHLTGTYEKNFERRQGYEHRVWGNVTERASLKKKDFHERPVNRLMNC